jgi:cellulase
MVKYSLLAAALMGLAAAQTPGKGKENHPKLTTWECTKKGCKAQDTAIVLDAGSRPNYQKNNPSLNCGAWGSAANKTVCPDEKTCAQNCLMDGIPNYADYGITTKGGSLKLDFFGKNGFQSPRAYLLAKGEKQYEMLKLTGKELTFDVDISKAPCGMNGALYLSEMKADGGKSKLNTGGAAYGTGYCDAQCFVTPFVDGVVSTTEPFI